MKQWKRELVNIPAKEVLYHPEGRGTTVIFNKSRLRRFSERKPRCDDWGMGRKRLLCVRAYVFWEKSDMLLCVRMWGERVICFCARYWREEDAVI